MARVSRPKNGSAAFSSLWRREPPKRLLAASELSAPVCRTLVAAIARQVPVAVQLHPVRGHQVESKAFFPLEIFARGAHVFLDCRSYPEGEDCTLRLDQIVGAQCEVVSGANEAADSATLGWLILFRRAIMGHYFRPQRRDSSAPSPSAGGRGKLIHSSAGCLPLRG
jgi:hypothetical protein